MTYNRRQTPLDLRVQPSQLEDAKIIRHGQPISASMLSRAETLALAKIVAQAQAIYDALIEKYGEEPQQDGAVIRFTRTFPGRDWDMPFLAEDPKAKQYHYAAIRINGRWWTTGIKQDGGYDWAELLAWIDESNVPEEVEVLSHGAKNVVGVVAERHPGLDPHEPNAPEAKNEGRHAAE